MIREVDMVNNNPFARRIEYVDKDKIMGYLDYSLIYDRMEIDNFLVLSFSVIIIARTYTRQKA